MQYKKIFLILFISIICSQIQAKNTIVTEKRFFYIIPQIARSDGSNQNLYYRYMGYKPNKITLNMFTPYSNNGFFHMPLKKAYDVNKSPEKCFYICEATELEFTLTFKSERVRIGLPTSKKKQIEIGYKTSGDVIVSPVSGIISPYIKDQRGFHSTYIDIPYSNVSVKMSFLLQPQNGSSVEFFISIPGDDDGTNHIYTLEEFLFYDKKSLEEFK